MKKEELKKFIVETVVDALKEDESLKELFGLNLPGTNRGAAGNLRRGPSVGGGAAAMTPAAASETLKKLAQVAVAKIKGSAEGARLRPGDILSNEEQMEVLQALNAKSNNKFKDNVGAAFAEFVKGMVQPALGGGTLEEGVAYTFSRKA